MLRTANLWGTTVPREMHLCECCRRVDNDLIYCRSTDEYLCEECIMLRAQEYYERRWANKEDDLPIITTTIPTQPTEE